MKYLGAYLDRNLNYQDEQKNILRKMACNIKTIYYVRDFLPEKTRLLLLNSLVIDQSSPVFIGIFERYLSESNFDCGKTIELEE